MIVGVTAADSKTQYYINQAYIKYVKDAGCEPVLLAPETSPAATVSVCDALLLPGGSDVDPIYYGYDNYNCMGTNPDRDEFERSMFHRFRNAGKPVFGICRGLQLIAREYLLYHKAARTRLTFRPHVDRHDQTAQNLERHVKCHFVERSPKLYNGDGGNIQMSVNSMHHQCVEYKYASKSKDKYIELPPIEGFEILATTERGLKDTEAYTICEAFEIHGWGGPVMGVQWHPEELGDFALLKCFLERGAIQENMAA